MNDDNNFTHPMALNDADFTAQIARALRHTRLYGEAIRNRLLKMELKSEQQFIRHGFGWFMAYIESLAAMLLWLQELQGTGKCTDLEKMIVWGFYAEYLMQLRHGIAMSQDEIIRPEHFTAENLAEEFSQKPEIKIFFTYSLNSLAKDLVMCAQEQQSFGNYGLDETLAMIGEQFRKFTAEKITPNASQWHDEDLLIPDNIIAELSELGVFGLTIREEYGGTGLGKMAMCVVTEELSRGYIGVGSLATRSEIAGELIQTSGTEAQKQKYLPSIASGEILPVAVFTEPNTGSDLASLQTRAVKKSDGTYAVIGNKTWITHAGRTDLMTLLARTNPDEAGHRGLSMFLAEKKRGDAEIPFPDAGIEGTEIKVLGYRGMKEYEMAFNHFAVEKDAILGGVEGKGFPQLMQTFESARIQTASRAIGVAMNGLSLSFNYACDRVQFGKPIIQFERIYGKLARMIVEIMGIRQLTYMAGRKKDQGGRCDVEAGMAKLLAARLAWSVADNGLQIHGGNGYALEYPISRILCDARILNIFEGAAEMQAEIIARGLLPK